MALNFPQVMKNIKSQIRETQLTLSKEKCKENHTSVQCSETEMYKSQIEKNFKSTRGGKNTQLGI